MTPRPDAHGIDVTLSVEPGALPERAQVTSPLCIALFGDFSARAHRATPASSIASRAPIAIDRDNFDAVLGTLRPELRLRVRGERDPGVQASFSGLEDFHPDSLYARLPLFEGVRELHQRVTAALSETRRPRPEQPRRPRAPGGSILDAIVEESSGPAEVLSPLHGGDLQAYLNSIVAPHIVSGPDPRGQAILAELDAAAADGMRALLHQPAFQALEGLWRGVALLTDQIESDEDVRVYLVDASKTELAADPEGTQRLLAEPPPGAEQAAWGALGGLFAIGQDASDLKLLARLGEMGRVVGAPWITMADPGLFGWSSFDAVGDPSIHAIEQTPEWQALRGMPAAHWLGLVVPRVLLRLPYGARGASCETLRFEELGDPPLLGQYLWGNPAVICLALLTATMAHGGRAVYPGMSLELAGLPLYAPRGATSPRPCVEVAPSEGAVERLLDAGVMVLAPIAGTDRVRLVRFQSVADPAAPLAGARLDPGRSGNAGGRV